ncbi:MAG: RsmD family RNA methyltransferase [Alphaproteobacteria bacterium]|nr:RsmD family RNA methyltransferase [Alphaproteobacteria bacterium]
MSLLAAVGTPRRFSDYYSGVGTFTFALASRAPVHAVEGDAEAARALSHAAARANLGDRVTVERRDLARRPVSGEDLARFDAVVFDPPRTGAAAQSRELAASPVPRVVAVSCNPATFARDARILVDGGYTLAHVAPVDSFIWSPHLELVARFERR